MNLLHDYIDQQMVMAKLGNQRQFFSSRQDTMPRGNGLGGGGGVPQESSTGLDDGGFKKQPSFVKQAVKEAGSDKKEQKEAPDASDTIKVSGTAGSSLSSSSSPPSMETPPEHKGETSGFSRIIDDFGADFKNSRSRKSPIFVAEDKTIPLIGWKSLRSAGLTSKKLGKLTTNGTSIPFTQDNHKGKMFFLSDSSLKALKRKKHVEMR
jgi:hypothetical protein